MGVSLSAGWCNSQKTVDLLVDLGYYISVYVHSEVMMLEIWDGYNADRTLAGVDIVRG